MDQLPPGLGELYGFFLRLLREAVKDERVALGATGDEGYARAWDTVYRPLLGVLAVARAPLTVAELTQFGPSTVEPAAVADALGRLGQFLDHEDGRLRLYHVSFPEYLTADATRAGHPADHVDPAAWHRRVGTRAAEDLASDGYGLRHAAEHLALSLRGEDDPAVRERLAVLPRDLAYAEAKTSALGIDALIGELRLVEEALGAGAASEALRVYGQEAHNLRGWVASERPAWFAQGVHNRAVTLGYDALASAAGARLAELGAPHLLLRWRTLRDSPALLSTLRGHESWAAGVALTPDGQGAVSSGRDGTLRGWDLRTGREEWVARVADTDADLWRVALTPDGRRALVGGSSDAPPAIVDVRTGELLRPLSGYPDTGPLAVLADGRRVACRATDGVAIWPVDGGEAARGFGGLGEVPDLVALPDGRLAALEGSLDALTIFDPDSGAVSVRIGDLRPDVLTYVTGLAVSGDASRALVARSKGPVLVLDVVAGRLERELDCGDETVFSVAITPDGRRALVGAKPTVTLWDLDRGRRLRELSGHSNQIRGVALTADAALGVSAGGDNDLRVWDLVDTHAGRFERGHAFSVNGVALSADGTRGASGSVDGLVKAFDVAAGRVLHTLDGHHGVVRDVVVLPDGSRAISAGLDRTLVVWDLDDCGSSALEGHEHWVTEVDADPDGTGVVSGSHDGTTRAWRLAGGLLGRRRSVLLRDQTVEALALSDDGAFVVVGHLDRVLRIRRRNGETIDELHAGVGQVSNLAVEPGSRRVLVSGNDGSLVVWEPGTGAVRSFPPPRPPQRFPAAGSGGHRGDGAAAFLAPGLAAVARSYGVVEVFDLDAGAVLGSAPLDHPPVSVTAVPGGTTLLVGDRSGDVHCLAWVATPRSASAKTTWMPLGG
jgi:WD40 repeat protein